MLWLERSKEVRLLLGALQLARPLFRSGIGDEDGGSGGAKPLRVYRQLGAVLCAWAVKLLKRPRSMPGGRCSFGGEEGGQVSPGGWRPDVPGVVPADVVLCHDTGLRR